MTEDDRKLLQDILDAVACEDAGTTDRFMYVWAKDWRPLKERIKDKLKQPTEGGNTVSGRSAVSAGRYEG